jgi:general stress protein 26
MNQEFIRKAEEIVARYGVHNGAAGFPACALGQVEADGSPTAAAITVARAEGIRYLTFSTGLSTNKVKRLAHSNKACVCFLSEEYNVSLMGTLEVSTDPALKRETWYDALKHHFSGPEDPEFCVLKFTTERYTLLIDWQEARGEV